MMILLINVDNLFTKIIISNVFACNNTSDKVFILSVQESTTYYKSWESRMAEGTEYAKTQGLFISGSNGNSYWWLRSPHYDYADNAYFVGLTDNYGDVFVCPGDVSGTYYGVRPVCWINL